MKSRSWDGEAHPLRGWRTTVVIRERGKRTRKLHSQWRSEPNKEGAFYLGRMELGRRLLAEEIENSAGKGGPQS